MIQVDALPRNREHFLQLLAFAKVVVDISKEIGVEPVASGSLALFAYTNNLDLSVNDIDLSCIESAFARIRKALNEHDIEWNLTEWHVLQALRGDLKVEFDSREIWINDLEQDYETLQIQDLQVRVIGLNDLSEMYRRGLNATASSDDDDVRSKHDALRVKYDALLALSSVNGID
jgi:hypothetical protein